MKQQLLKAEEQMRVGQVMEVRDFLAAFNPKKATREEVVWAAQLARRAGQPQYTLRWLKARVRSPRMKFADATVAERAEYAMALQRFGAYPEAQKLMNDVNHNDLPISDFYRALSHMMVWEHAEALPYLERYLLSPENEYQALIVRVNRAACLVAERQWAAAEEEVAGLRTLLNKDGMALLNANVFMISAQMHIERGDLDKAKSLLLETGETNQAHIPDQLFIKKWLTVIEARKSGNTALLDALRAEALKIKHWETLRDLDFQRHLITPDLENARWIYYGTPHSYFRTRLESHFPELKYPSSAPISRLKNPLIEIDPMGVKVGFGEVIHATVMTLLQDFYRPLRVAEIFSNLFPGDYFDLDVSVNRVHQTIKRSRTLIERWGWPARIEEVDGTYGLRWENNVALKVSPPSWPVTPETIMERKLKTEFANKEFTSTEAAQVLELSQSQASRWLKRLYERNLVQRYGAGKNLRYEF